jgi:hypothetical protein
MRAPIENLGKAARSKGLGNANALLKTLGLTERMN